MEDTSVIVTDEEPLQTAESTYTGTFAPVTENPQTKVKTSSVIVLGTSAVVIALYLAVVIGIATWSDNHRDTGIIADEADSSNADESVAAGPRGSGQASLSPKSPASATDDENDKPHSLFTVRPTKRRADEIVDTSPPAAVDAADTTAIESIEERGKPRIPRRRASAGPQSPMTSVADDLATIPIDADIESKRYYVSRGKRPSTSVRTTSDYDWETPSAVEEAIVPQTSAEEEVSEPASPTRQDIDITDWLTVVETAEATPDTSTSIETAETVSANAMSVATAHKARGNSHTTTEAVTTTRQFRKRHHHHLWRGTTNEIAKLPASTKHERSKSTGHVSTALTRRMRKINAAVAAKRNITTFRTTPTAQTPSVGDKHRLEKKITERIAKAFSIRRGQKARTKARSPLSTGRTVKGHKIVGRGRRRNSITVKAKTVKAFSIMPRQTSEQVA